MDTDSGYSRRLSGAAHTARTLRSGFRRRARSAVVEGVHRLDRRYGVVADVRRSDPAADAPTPESPPAPAAPPLAAPTSFHDILHETRTIALSQMPPGAKTLLSAGANGRWYFDWVDQSYGVVERHIGVEAYCPRPDDLPANAEWVDADIASADGVAGLDPCTVDLVLSGQNVEHLWPEQVVNFFLESHRVLRPGGLLVVDSPNRELTASYQWSMSEHTVEYTPGEAERLFALAGFRVERVKGLWLCRDGSGLLPLEPPDPWDVRAVMRRAVLAGDRPDDSFIWWIEATKDGEPDPEALRGEIDGIFARHWAERVARLQIQEIAEVDDSTGARIASVAKGANGYVLLGPWMVLPEGEFAFSLDVEWDGSDAEGEEVVALELVANNQLLASTPLHAAGPSGRAAVSVSHRYEDTTFAVHVRLRSTGRAGLKVDLGLGLEPAPWTPA